ncbi:MAG: hypothetical protein P1U77_26660 [Rubripirellula sp.]|nr:hypothetical protein [Rubripirellula sp.]
MNALLLYAGSGLPGSHLATLTVRDPRGFGCQIRFYDHLGEQSLASLAAPRMWNHHYCEIDGVEAAMQRRSMPNARDR